MAYNTTETANSTGNSQTVGHRNLITPDLGVTERDYVYAVAMKYVKDTEAAEDVTQDALLLAHRHRANFRGDSRYSTWLYRIAASAALMYLRKKKRRSREILIQVRDEDDGTIFDSSQAADTLPDEQVAHSQAMAIITQGLDQLGDKYRCIFWMRYVEGYTETEIASQLDLTLATVKTRAHRARVAIRDTLRAAA